MKNDVILDFQEEIIKKAVKLVDKDKMAKELSKILEKEVGNQWKRLIEDGIDLEYWITDMLTNKNTAAGKTFEKAIKDITKRMADSI